MSVSSIIRFISIVFYLLIMLQGDMIALPFAFWIAFSLFDFSTIAPLFAFSAVGGLLLTCFISRFEKSRALFLAIAFLLLLSPLVYRMIEVPLYMFDYLAFKLPLAIFVILFVSSVYLNFWEQKKRILSPKNSR